VQKRYNKRHLNSLVTGRKELRRSSRDFLKFQDSRVTHIPLFSNELILLIENPYLFPEPHTQASAKEWLAKLGKIKEVYAADANYLKLVLVSEV
jgi:hypothetical protein